MRNNVSVELQRICAEMYKNGTPLESAMLMFEDAFLHICLEQNKFNQCKTAVEIGVHRNTISRMLRRQRLMVRSTINRGVLAYPEPVEAPEEPVLQPTQRKEVQAERDKPLTKKESRA